MIRLLYRAARIFGDYQAIKKGRFPQRMVRRGVYRQSNQVTRRVLRRVGL